MLNSIQPGHNPGKQVGFGYNIKFDEQLLNKIAERSPDTFERTCILCEKLQTRQPVYKQFLISSETSDNKAPLNIEQYELGIDTGKQNPDSENLSVLKGYLRKRKKPVTVQELVENPVSIIKALGRTIEKALKSEKEAKAEAKKIRETADHLKLTNAIARETFVLKEKETLLQQAKAQLLKAEAALGREKEVFKEEGIPGQRAALYALHREVDLRSRLSPELPKPQITHPVPRILSAAVKAEPATPPPSPTMPILKKPATQLNDSTIKGLKEVISHAKEQASSSEALGEAIRKGEEKLETAARLTESIRQDTAQINNPVLETQKISVEGSEDLDKLPAFEDTND